MDSQRILIQNSDLFTVHSNSFYVLGRISTSQDKQYSSNTDYMRQNRTVRQMNDPLLVKFMCWSHVRSRTKFGPDRFSRFDVYWKQPNKQTNKQTDRQTWQHKSRQTSKVYIYIDNTDLRSNTNICIFVYMLAIAGQTAGQNWLTFFREPMGTLAVLN